MADNIRMWYTAYGLRVCSFGKAQPGKIQLKQVNIFVYERDLINRCIYQINFLNGGEKKNMKCRRHMLVSMTMAVLLAVSAPGLSFPAFAQEEVSTEEQVLTDQQSETDNALSSSGLSSMESSDDKKEETENSITAESDDTSEDELLKDDVNQAQENAEPEEVSVPDNETSEPAPAESEMIQDISEPVQMDSEPVQEESSLYRVNVVLEDFMYADFLSSLPGSLYVTVNLEDTETGQTSTIGPVVYYSDWMEPIFFNIEAGAKADRYKVSISFSLSDDGTGSSSSVSFDEIYDLEHPEIEFTDTGTTDIEATYTYHLKKNYMIFAEWRDADDDSELSADSEPSAKVTLHSGDGSSSDIAGETTITGRQVSMIHNLDPEKNYTPEITEITDGWEVDTIDQSRDGNCLSLYITFKRTNSSSSRLYIYADPSLFQSSVIHLNNNNQSEILQTGGNRIIKAGEPDTENDEFQNMGAGLDNEIFFQGNLYGRVIQDNQPVSIPIKVTGMNGSDTSSDVTLDLYQSEITVGTRLKYYFIYVADNFTGTSEDLKFESTESTGQIAIEKKSIRKEGSDYYTELTLQNNSPEEAITIKKVWGEQDGCFCTGTEEDGAPSGVDTIEVDLTNDDDPSAEAINVNLNRSDNWETQVNIPAGHYTIHEIATDATEGYIATYTIGDSVSQGNYCAETPQTIIIQNRQQEHPSIIITKTWDSQFVDETKIDPNLPFYDLSGKILIDPHIWLDIYDDDVDSTTPLTSIQIQDEYLDNDELSYTDRLVYHITLDTYEDSNGEIQYFEYNHHYRVVERLNGDEPYVPEIESYICPLGNTIVKINNTLISRWRIVKVWEDEPVPDSVYETDPCNPCVPCFKSALRRKMARASVKTYPENDRQNVTVDIYEVDENGVRGEQPIKTVTLTRQNISGSYFPLYYKDLDLEALPDGHHYEFVEKKMDGWTVEEPVIEYKNGLHVVILRNKPSVSLSVRKTVSGEGVTAEDRNREFSFTVQLNNTEISGKYGDFEFENGKAEIKLRDGQVATAVDLPYKAGMTYTVSETYVKGYHVTMTDSAGNQTEGTKDNHYSVSGDLKWKEKNAVAFVNTKDMPEEPKETPEEPDHDSPGGGTPESGTWAIKVNKIWVNDDLSTRPSSVQMQLYKNGQAYGNPVTLTENGEWSYTWNNLEANQKYTVSEINVPEGYHSTVTNKKSVWTVTNTKLPVAMDTSVDMPSGPKEAESRPFTGTGDNSQAGIWLLLMVASAGVLLTIAVRKRRNGR